MKGDVRTGIFVCSCGSNIGGFLDVHSVAEYARTLQGVVHSEHNLYTCADDGLTSIKTAIVDHNLNRVVVASCTPRTHAPLFQRICEEAGLNKYLFTFVNIREQCSWVHMKEPEKATEKAKDLLRMGAARAALLEPQQEIRVPVTPSVLVVGGGTSGMTAALNLARNGFDTYLVEKEPELGGILRDLNTLYQTRKSPDSALKNLIGKVTSNRNIHVLTSTTLRMVEGFVGNYKTVIGNENGETSLDVGAIILATGAEEYKPHGFYGYGKLANVVTMMEFEKMQKAGSLPVTLNGVAFIQCVGARGQDKSYCSRTCCTVSLKNAVELVEKGPGSSDIAEVVEEGKSRRRARRRGTGSRTGSRTKLTEIVVFNRDIMTYGVEHEAIYSEARKKHVRFVRFTPERIPEVRETDDGRLEVTYFHESLGEERKTSFDLVVLSAPVMKHADAEDLSRALKVPLGQDGFFLEAHVKLRPVEFATDGIFLCGSCHGPATIDESVEQALAAASRASISLTRGYVIAEALTPVIDEDRCTGCETCIEICPYSALVKNGETGKVEVIAAACKGCGNCGSLCPQKAMTMLNYTDDHLFAETRAALEEVFENV